MKERNVSIEIKGLSYTYSDGPTALESIDLKIYHGETIALVGPNGAGKSTLLSHLNGVIPKQSGRIIILGTEMNRKNINEIRGKVGLVLQDPEDQLFMATVFDDVAFGPVNMDLPEDRIRKRVKMALKKVGLDGYDDRCPHHLSIGEKKKVSIATILSMRPRIILMDEPTSNLDPCARNKMIGTINELGTTSIIASHDIEMLLETCHRALLLNRGRIVEDGPAEDILTDPKLLKKHGLEVPTIVKVFGKDAVKMIREERGLNS